MGVAAADAVSSPQGVSGASHSCNGADREAGEKHPQGCAGGIAGSQHNQRCSKPTASECYTSPVVTDTSYSVIKQNTDFTVQQGRKIARKQIEKYRERRSAEQTETTRVHTANERGVSPKQVECGTLSDAERHPHRGADLPRQRAKEKVDTAKTAPRDIRGVTQGQRQLRTAANETVRSITTQA